MFVDSHAHLDSSDFQSDLSEVLERAAAVGVGRILTIGCIGEKPSAVSRVIELVEKHEPLFAALGVHPHDARFFSVDLGEEILKWMTHPKVLGWGEIGLDYHYDQSPRDQQHEAFRTQLRLARAAQKTGDYSLSGGGGGPVPYFGRRVFYWAWRSTPLFHLQPQDSREMPPPRLLYLLRRYPHFS